MKNTLAHHCRVVSAARRLDRHDRHAAFTLIELLVVISIIVLLISILLPALRAARKTALQAACLSNQRQVGLGLNVYSEDYDGWFPAPYGNGLPASIDNWGALMYLKKYLPREIMFCTESPVPANLNAGYSYGMIGTYVSSENTRTRLTPFDAPFPVELHPSDQMILTCSRYLMAVEEGVFIIIPDVQSLLTRKPCLRHQSKFANAWYADGHAASTDGEELIEYGFTPLPAP